jgi:hypothetical protein
MGHCPGGHPGVAFRTATALPDALPLLAVKYVMNFNSPPPDPAQFDLVYSNVVTIYRNSISRAGP